jgi:hypothetical protein
MRRRVRVSRERAPTSTLVTHCGGSPAPRNCPTKLSVSAVSQSADTNEPRAFRATTKTKSPLAFQYRSSPTTRPAALRGGSPYQLARIGRIRSVGEPLSTV